MNNHHLYVPQKRSPLNQVFRITQQRLILPHRRRKVAIIGASDGSTLDAPLHDPNVEVWGLNTVIGPCVDTSGVFRADRWFELHDVTERVCRRRRPPGYAQWLRTLRLPIYQFHGRADTKTSLPYPLEWVLKTTGGEDFFGCTFAYEIALALAEGFTTISLYGCALQTGREALVERPSVEYWRGLAHGRGVSVTVHGQYEEGTGRHPYRYGFHQVEERNAAYRFCQQHLISNAAYIASRGDGLA